VAVVVLLPTNNTSNDWSPIRLSTSVMAMTLSLLLLCMRMMLSYYASVGVDFQGHDWPIW